MLLESSSTFDRNNVQQVMFDESISSLTVLSAVLDSRPSQLSVYVQLPQNILIGFSQLFGMVGSYEYAYFVAPRSGQSLFMSLHFCAIGLSFMLGTIYINVFPRSNVNIDFKVSENSYNFRLLFRCPLSSSLVSNTV